ncbi:MerR family DNA-binding transcriptional regulator [Blastopirellula sp. J2-11]|uniref:MerR family DNA-binding transcriptional regulator n=1 Tax=Blastopirellula sp. J2-11 TaxID=2943192 RepID=UPI0021C81174|nr:MerR family DNA-binding transcriptional regulator [Blastopirellula sp. J2-11]UUO07885.1 MerR family DNA-binding transcriptional regulator [Blastopirellula sp. J2-11]
MEKLSDYVKTAEAAEILGVSQTTLRKYATIGKIPVRINPANGYRLFLKTDLKKFLKAASKPISAPRRGEMIASGRKYQ